MKLLVIFEIAQDLRHHVKNVSVTEMSPEGSWGMA